MEHNQITLTGCPIGAPQYSHSNHGRNFYSFFLEVERLSGTVDRLHILVPESLLFDEIPDGASVLTVEGQIRSFNNRSTQGRKFIISVLASSLTFGDAPHENRVELQGIICKDPIYRRTPLGREICDVMLAVNCPYRRADYIPCILWGRTAQEAAAFPVGTTLTLTGRLQSRDYLKLLGSESEQRTAYEVSVITAEAVNG